MTLLQWFRDRLGLDPRMSKEQLYAEMLTRAARLARRGKVEVLQGGYRALESAMYDHKNHVLIVVVKGRKIKRPKELLQWFQDFKM